MILARVAGRIFDQPLAVHPLRLRAILHAIGPRIGVPESAVPEVGAAVGSSGRKPYAMTRDGIAVIGVSGTLVYRAANAAPESGITAYEWIDYQVTDAATDPNVRGILLDVDSYGGEASGIEEVVSTILSARDIKPVFAVANPEAYSAGYWIAACASRLYVPSYGGVGSVGVVAVHMDQTASDAKEGVKFTAVTRGARKLDGWSHAPLSDEAFAKIDEAVGRAYEAFVRGVSVARGVSEKLVRDTEAEIYLGEDAVRAGLADRVGSIKDALADMQSELSARAPGKGKTEKAMADEVVIDLSAEREKGRKEARAEERARIAGIGELCALAGCPERVGGFLNDPEMTVDKARSVLMSERAQRSEADPVDGRHDGLAGPGAGSARVPGENALLKASRAIADRMRAKASGE